MKPGLDFVPDLLEFCILRGSVHNDKEALLVPEPPVWGILFGNTFGESYSLCFAMVLQRKGLTLPSVVNLSKAFYFSKGVLV